MSDIRTSIIQFCADIGADPLIVQGAGGNVSWKDDEALWIKASGTWLSEANFKDIFVAVDISSLKQSIRHGDFSASLKLKRASALKPSIETVIHALVPSKVVAHLHSIEILSHLVRDNCETEICHLLSGKFRYVMVDYFKPGADLAAAVSLALKNNSFANIIFLKNHGIVIGGESVEDVRQTLDLLNNILCTPTSNGQYFDLPVSEIDGYSPVVEIDLHRLAIESRFFNKIQKCWALYPDHVVFLGAKPFVFSSWNELRQAITVAGELPELVFIKNKGTFVFGEFGRAKLAQLRCYYDVLSRQTYEANLNSLSSDQVQDILNWDAEKYRMALAKG